MAHRGINMCNKAGGSLEAFGLGSLEAFELRSSYILCKMPMAASMELQARPPSLEKNNLAMAN